MYPLATRFVNPLRPAVALGAALLLAACGGGSSTPASPGTPGQPHAPAQPSAPTIEGFGADRESYSIGERAMLTFRFSGGEGRIEPGFGAVQSGAPLQTGPLDGPREYTLTVSSAAGTVTRTVRLEVAYRDRYREVAGGSFRAVGHSATALADGRVLLVGGWRGGPVPSPAIELYEPQFDSFRRIGSLANGREGHRATLLADGRVLLTGGLMGPALSGAELVDPATGAVTSGGLPHVHRVGHTATLLADGRVLLTGGASADGDRAGQVTDTAEVYDPATGQFQPLTDRLVVPRANHSASRLADGRVLIVGGLTAPDRTYAAAEVFDPATLRFERVPAADERVRALHASATLPNGDVFVLGGEDADGRANGAVLRFEGTVSSVAANLGQPRTLVEAVTTRDGRVLLFGGEVGTQPAPSASAEAWSPATGARALRALPGARIGHTATRMLDGRILIAGGDAGDDALLATALVYE